MGRELPHDGGPEMVVDAEKQWLGNDSAGAVATRPMSEVAYEARKAEIARAVNDHPGEFPAVDYTAAEDGVWRAVHDRLGRLHPDRACLEFNEGAERLKLGRDEVPALADVSERLAEISGFALQPAPGILPPDEFYSVLEGRSFCSAIFVRSPESPFFTQDPDVLHELIGHASSLANPRIARLYEIAGQTFNRLTHPIALDRFSRIFWFIFETAVIEEAGDRRAFGAAVLSSVTELEGLDEAELLSYGSPTDLVSQPYSITEVQPAVFGFESFEHLEAACDELFDPGVGDADYLAFAPESVG